MYDVINMSSVTLDDCIKNYCYKDKRTVVNDGKLKSFIDEKTDPSDRSYYKKYLN